MMTPVIIPLNYLPSVSWWATAIRYGDVILEIHETFPKQTYRNRCHIYSAQGSLPLIIPVVRTFGNHTRTLEVNTDQAQSWQKIHWRTIVSAYNKSPYFLYYKDSFQPFFMEPAGLLTDFNLGLLQLCCKVLKLRDIKFSLSETYQQSYPFPDFRQLLHPKKDVSLAGFMEFPRYIQPFEEKHGFIQDLSIIDLLFNEGPGATEILHRIIEMNPKVISSMDIRS